MTLRSGMAEIVLPQPLPIVAQMVICIMLSMSVGINNVMDHCIYFIIISKIESLFE